MIDDKNTCVNQRKSCTGKDLNITSRLGMLVYHFIRLAHH